MVQNASYAAPRASLRLQPEDENLPDQPLLWGRGVLLGLTLAAAVIALSFVVARVTLAAPLTAVRVRLDITDVMAQAVTGHFGSRERVVVFYTLREIRIDHRPPSNVTRRAVFNLSANTHAYDLFSPVTLVVAPESAIFVDMRLYALDEYGSDLYMLETDPNRAIASGQAVLVGCVTHTLRPDELTVIVERGGSYPYGGLPGTCTTGAALPVTASPYRVRYAVNVDSSP